MKIRIRGNSIRYRLTKTEVNTLSDIGYYENSTDFGDQKFIYAVKAIDDVEVLNVDFKDNAITLYMNRAKSLTWPKSRKVGFSNVVKTKNGNELSLLLEKDFVCMDETVEDQSDNYPNPKSLKK
ncbi:hypothetical protein J8L85_05780 [Maribacter sp. MMG018]|uniref:DUF7009 family protein n=1 Tax=Maribacter sp. MMG018 TaxID=2822688 RepID=UPI001B38655F|nr:hypothetical protein [Maribacter sp. MMG018]MBQ4913937.1 hypothetical protein [Maribacter sp. MMG018]